MRLADFIEAHLTTILSEWESFAASLLPAAEGMTVVELRDHAEQILEAVTKDLRTAQSAAQQFAKSLGQAPRLFGAPETAAQTHAVLRARGGFGSRQLVAEYRALRSSVLRLWGAVAPSGPEAMADIGRFNEAIDQAIAESVDFYMTEVDRWRSLFLGVLGHDLRGPLSAVLMTSQVMSALSQDPAMSAQGAKLLRSGERMRVLLDDLLDYNRVSLNVGFRIRPERVDVGLACQEEIEVLRSALPTFSLEFRTAGDSHGYCDPSRIRQAIHNLVMNAARYGDPAGKIVLSIVGSDSALAISVENSGPPIPKEIEKSLFEPLRRFNLSDSPAESGLGLGLFIVEHVATAHGGSVSVECRDGRTRFTISIPRGPMEMRAALP